MGEIQNVIIVPVLESDLGLIKSVLRYWVHECPPLETGSEAVSKLDLIYVFSGSENAGVKEAMEAILDESEVRKHFRKVFVHFAGVPPELDYYQRNTKGLPPTANGFASGPNEVFFHMATAFGNRYECSLLMELDCLPIRGNWAELLQEEMKKNPQAWVTGSCYQGWSWLSPGIKNHINGNAIYRFSDPDFQKFLKEVWKPGVKELQQWGYPELAYDCFPALLESLSRGPLVPGELRAKASMAFGRFHESYFVLNLGGSEDARSDYRSLELLKKQNPQTIMFHAGWLMDELLEPAEMLRPEQGKSASVAEKCREEELTHSIKHIYASEGVWIYGNRFSFMRKESVITLHILLDKKKLHKMTVRVESNERIPMMVRSWNETFSVGLNFFSAIGAILKYCGLFRLFHLTEVRKYLRNRLSWIDYFSRNSALSLVRISIAQLRGRKITSAENEVSFSTKQLKKSNGVIVTLSCDGALVEGTIHVRVEN
ncbi:MAG: hypothetical protein P1U81_03395 [Verrucomicrobiales bacterium]|nr:hypothetical protein [Verrucomicrobiales bacterium]